MENNGTVDAVSHEDKLHVVCAVMGISSEVLLQRVVDRYYSMLVRHAGTFEDAVPNVESGNNVITPAANDLSPAPEASTSDATDDDKPLSVSLDSDYLPPPADDASSPMLANGTSLDGKEKRTRRWSSLPTEELDKMIVEALQKKGGTCNLRELTIVTGYTSTSRLLERAHVLAAQGKLKVTKEGRSYLIGIADR